MQGELVGINTAIFTRSGGSNGIGFAVPINMVRQVIEAERRNGVIVRPWFGAELSDVTSDVARAIGLDRPFGAVVTLVHKNSPAEKAGIRANDIIVNLNESGVQNANEFDFKFATLRVGEQAQVKILRKDSIVDIEINLAPALDDRSRDEILITGSSPFSGATVANITPALAVELGLDPALKFVAVIDVEQGSPAARLGFERGDVIEAIEGIAINNTTQLDEIAQGNRAVWRFRYHRDGRVFRQIIRG